MTLQKLSVCLSFELFCLSPVLAQAYRTPEEVQAALQEMAAESGGALRLETLGETSKGRKITAATLSLPGPLPAEKRQAILIVAGLEGNLLYTTEIVLGSLQSLVRRRQEPLVAEALRRVTLYFVPQANPDGASRYFARPRWESARNLRPDDSDRDLRVDEDGPEDLDGDGEILLLRAPDPDGPFELDPEEPRILRPVTPERGSSARFRVLEEGIDNDGDGLFNEDPPGGVNFAQNFAHAFSERGAGAGRYPSSEPESKALLDFLLAHPNIEAGMTYGAHDNLVATPPPRDGPPEPRGESRLWKPDAELYARVGERYRELTGQKGKPPSAPLGGAWHETLYFDFGLVSFAAALFGGEAPALPASAVEKGAVEGAPRPSPPATLPPELAVEKGWLEWNDRVLGGKGFMPWSPYFHPQLGWVHLGGWRPYVRSNPPPADLPGLVNPQVQFLLHLASRLSRVLLEPVRLKELGDGLFDVRARLVNLGDFPTALQQGIFTSRRSPLNVEISGSGLRVIGGDARQTLESLPGQGSSRELRWIVAGARGSDVTIEARLRSLVLTTTRLSLSSGGSL
jgi:hypothetical protein